MTIHDFTTELFVRVDDAMTHQEKHPQALLYPSEIVTLGMLFALKGVGTRAFYRWAKANLAPLFPHLPERTRLGVQSTFYYRSCSFRPLDGGFACI